MTWSNTRWTWSNFILSPAENLQIRTLTLRCRAINPMVKIHDKMSSVIIFLVDCCRFRWFMRRHFRFGNDWSISWRTHLLSKVRKWYSFSWFGNVEGLFVVRMLTNDRQSTQRCQNLNENEYNSKTVDQKFPGRHLINPTTHMSDNIARTKIVNYRRKGDLNALIIISKIFFITLLTILEWEGYCIKPQT